MVMVYWQQALEIPFGRVQALKIGTSVEEDIAELARAFPPPRSEDLGVRHQHFEKALKRHEVEDVESHFARWVATGAKGYQGSCTFSRFDIFRAILLQFQAVNPSMHLQ
ncbi:hypothetical protein BGX38DRAFT_1330154 [Terfezia claveryi]|nr:hypothetical protein BGX38DRAFT_1330154 [Terfezia claveryi]